MVEVVAQEKRDEALVDALLMLWEASVRQTHLFLGEGDIAALRPVVAAGLRGTGTLALVRGEHAVPCGFLGVDGDAIEMLFVAPGSFGQGVGRQLMAYAVDGLGARRLEVNEDNPGARRFYEHLGFAVTGRCEVDGQGNPFPLLHMELQGGRLL